MRTLFVMSAFALFMTSCANHSDSFQEPIASLTTEWENTTTMVTDFVNSLQRTQQDLQNQFAEMTVPEELTLSEDSKNQIAELKDDYQEELSSLTDLSGEVSSFISTWQIEAEKLADLKINLSSGELGAGTLATVEALQETVEAGKAGLESWKGELVDIQANTSETLEEFEAVIANLQGN